MPRARARRPCFCCARRNLSPSRAAPYRPHSPSAPDRRARARSNPPMRSRRARRASFASTLALACGVASARAANPTRATRALPAASLRDVLRGDADDVVRAAFVGANAVGAMVVVDVGERYAEARRTGLEGLARCARDGRGAGTLTRSEAWELSHDGATRATLATRSRDRLPMELDDACGQGYGMRADLEAVRDGADVVARATLGRLDAAFHNATGGFYERSARSDASLDHFHAYGAPVNEEASGEDADSDVEGKHAHTDVGVAIVMTPALIRGEKPGASGSRGLYIGDIEPIVPDDGMIIMLGEAARAWVPGLSPELRKLIKVPTHAMRLTGDRAWFGRMVLPDTTTRHPTQDLSFGTWHDGATRAMTRSNAEAESARWAAVACPSPAVEETGLVGQTSRRRILSDDLTCGAGQIECWLSCVDAPACSTGTAQCIDFATGLQWGGLPNEHCDTCAPQCPGDNTTAPTGMCNTRLEPTTMFMDGFTLNGGGSTSPCVALLFRSWSLHTPALLALGFFATVVLGTSIELLASIRRKLQNPGFCNCYNIPTSRQRAYSVALYSIQVTFGYLLMLISMTYHFVLFSAVIIGLVIGHILFGTNAPVTATTSACCAHASPSDKDPCPSCGPDASAPADGDLPPCCAARAAARAESPDGSSLSGDSLVRPLTRARDVESGP